MKNIWYWVGGAILLLLILFFIFYQFGKSKGKALGSVNNITPPVGSKFQLSNADGSISAAITSLASQLYNDMNGINWFGFHNNALWLQVSQLTDGDLLNVYNSFTSTKALPGLYLPMPM